jgi:hypothetical protein
MVAESMRIDGNGKKSRTLIALLDLSVGHCGSRVAVLALKLAVVSV